MSAKILIIEDEEKLAMLLHDYLKQSCYSPVCLHHGGDAAAWIMEHKPDLVILDLMLPGRDGLEICKEVRMFSEVPIIMLTARVQEIDRILGLEIGADDYICKPFSPREVVARVKAVLRRTESSARVKNMGLILNEDSYKATLKGVDLGLTVVEFRLLNILRKNSGRILSRDQLMEQIYPDERIVSDRTIDSHVKNLRKKLAIVSPNQEIVCSVYGVGYQFDF